MIIGVVCPGTKAKKTWAECLSCHSLICPSIQERHQMLKDLQQDDQLNKFRASRISFNCEAMDILCKTMDYHIPMELLTIFLVGTGTHAEIQKAYRADKCEREFIIEEDGYIISGHIDIFDKGTIIDIKTCSTFIGLPKFYHKNQVSIYKASAERCGEVVTQLKIQAVNKGTGERQWYLIREPTMTWADICGFASHVMAYFRGDPIVPTFNRGSDACKVCPVEGYCEAFYHHVTKKYKS